MVKPVAQSTERKRPSQVKGLPPSALQENCKTAQNTSKKIIKRTELAGGAFSCRRNYDGAVAVGVNDVVRRYRPSGDADRAAVIIKIGERPRPARPLLSGAVHRPPTSTPNGMTRDK